MNKPQISKSSRHSKITGNYAEHSVLYWLSKYGFESAYVDHVGIDLIAKNPKTGEKMGISVKSRSRKIGFEKEHMNIGNTKETKEKIIKACEAFDLVPYIAILLDYDASAKIFILSLDKFIEIHKPKKVMIWYMGDKWMKKYLKDPDIKVIEFEHKITTWW